MPGLVVEKVIHERDGDYTLCGKYTGGMEDATGADAAIGSSCAGCRTKSREREKAEQKTG